MPLPSQPRTLGLLLYPGAQMAAVLGLTDLLEAADRLRALRKAPGPGLRVQHFGLEAAPGPNAPLAALVLPPSLGGIPGEEICAAWPQWILARHREGTLICSVCAGAFLLARTGLLAGRRATTHWDLADAFAAAFPEVQVDADKLIIEDGDLITAGGMMAWVDLGLRLVDRFLGPTVMLATARQFLVDPGGREQRFYSTFAPHLTHGDRAILRVQRWAQGRTGEKITLPEMASRAGLGERTFLRRFQKATGMNPVQYLQQLRIGKARELLEISDLTVDAIAWEVGYADPGAFRKVFHRTLGLSPGEYRRRFTIGPTSPH